MSEWKKLITLHLEFWMHPFSFHGGHGELCIDVKDKEWAPISDNPHYD